MCDARIKKISAADNAKTERLLVQTETNPIDVGLAVVFGVVETGNAHSATATPVHQAAVAARGRLSDDRGQSDAGNIFGGGDWIGDRGDAIYILVDNFLKFIFFSRSRLRHHSRHRHLFLVQEFFCCRRRN